MKTTVKIIIALVVLLVAGLLTLGLFIDSIVKKGVESVGPQIAKVDIKLDGVKLSLLSGGGSINGLVVGNPEGYKTPSALRVGTARLTLAPLSVLSEKIMVKEILVEGPEITIEGGLTDNNLTKIQANLAGASASEKSAPQGKGKKLQVDDFILRGAKVNLNLTMLNGKTATIPLPDIHLTGLGQGAEGITPADLAQRMFGEVVKKVLEVAPGAVADLGKGAIDAAKGAGQGAAKSLENVTKGVGNLFKK
jgi:hypothetical protein